MEGIRHEAGMEELVQGPLLVKLHDSDTNHEAGMEESVQGQLLVKLDDSDTNHEAGMEESVQGQLLVKLDDSDTNHEAGMEESVQRQLLVKLDDSDTNHEAGMEESVQLQLLVKLDDSDTNHEAGMEESVQCRLLVKLDDSDTNHKVSMEESVQSQLLVKLDDSDTNHEVGMEESIQRRLLVKLDDSDTNHKVSMEESVQSKLLVKLDDSDTNHEAGMEESVQRRLLVKLDDSDTNHEAGMEESVQSQLLVKLDDSDTNHEAGMEESVQRRLLVKLDDSDTNHEAGMEESVQRQLLVKLDDSDTNHEAGMEESVQSQLLVKLDDSDTNHEAGMEESVQRRLLVKLHLIEGELIMLAHRPFNEDTIKDIIINKLNEENMYLSVSINHLEREMSHYKTHINLSLHYYEQSLLNLKQVLGVVYQHNNLIFPSSTASAVTGQDDLTKECEHRPRDGIKYCDKKALRMLVYYFVQENKNIHLMLQNERENHEKELQTTINSFENYIKAKEERIHELETVLNTQMSEKEKHFVALRELTDKITKLEFSFEQVNHLYLKPSGDDSNECSCSDHNSIEQTPTHSKDKLRKPIDIQMQSKRICDTLFQLVKAELKVLHKQVTKERGSQQCHKGHSGDNTPTESPLLRGVADRLKQLIERMTWIENEIQNEDSLLVVRETEGVSPNKQHKLLSPRADIRKSKMNKLGGQPKKRST